MAAAKSSSTPPPAQLLLTGVPRFQGSTQGFTLNPIDALLLAWLSQNGPTPRERLAQLLWPDSEPEAARNALRQRLFRLRKQAGVELVVGNTVLLLGPAVSHDLTATSELLEGFVTAPTQTELQNWLREQRGQRAQRRRVALEAHIEAMEAAGDVAAALPLALQLLQQEPLSEDAHRRVMRLHYLRGDRAAALLAFDRCEELLKHEIGAKPSVQTLALLAVLQADGGGTQADGEPGGPAHHLAALSLAAEATSRTSATGAVGASGAAAGADGAGLQACASPVALALPVSLLRPPRLVGRDAELLQLQTAWAAASPVLVIGEAGIGKSRLLLSLQRHDAQIVQVAGRPGDNLVPYATLARLLTELVSRLGDALHERTRQQLAPLLPMFAEAAAPSRLAVKARGASLLPPVQALLQQVSTWVSGVVLDDVHFADGASVELLQQLLTAPRGDGSIVRWCLGLRPATGASAAAGAGAGAGATTPNPLQQLVEALVTSGPCARVVLNPLGDAQMAELIDSLHLPHVRGAEWAPALRQRSGGNPLFALETLKLAWNQGLLREPGSAPAALPRSQSLQQLIAQQLARLSPGALALARLAAIAALDFSLPLAEQVLGQSALQLADVWHELEAEQVLVDAEFAHDLVYESVLAGVPALIARHLHGLVAQCLERTAAAEPARMAAHWQAAGEPGRALPHLRAAADRAHLALREHERIELLLRAADIAQQRGDNDTAFGCVAAAVNSHMNTIRHTGGFSLLDRLDSLARTTTQRAAALGQRAWYCMQLADVAGALQYGRQALDLALQLPALQPAFAIRHRLATTLATAGRFAEAMSHFEMAQLALDRLAPGAVVPPPGVPAAPAIDPASSEAASAGEAAVLSDEDLAEYHGNHAAVLDNLGRADAARVQRQFALEAATRAGEPAQQVSQLANQVVSYLNAGRFTEALEGVEQAQRLIASYDMSGSTVGFVATLKLQACRALGRFADALAAADQAETILMASNPARLPVVHLHRGHCWLDLGQAARAQQALLAAGDSLAPHLQAKRCLLLARLLPREAGAWRERAAAVAPRDGWPEVALLVQLEAAMAGDEDAAWQAQQDIAARAAALNLWGVVRAAQLQRFKSLLMGASDRSQAPDAGRRRPAARRHVLDLAVADARALLNPDLPADATAASMAYTADLPWHAACLLQVMGLPAEALVLSERTQVWLRQCAATQVAAPFRSSFLQHNATNRALLAGMQEA